MFYCDTCPICDCEYDRDKETLDDELREMGLLKLRNLASRLNY
jgi:hypothetical protein